MKCFGCQTTLEVGDLYIEDTASGFIDQEANGTTATWPRSRRSRRGPMSADPMPSQWNSNSGGVAAVRLWRSWDFDPRAAGRRAVAKHADALRRLSQ